MAQRSYIAWRSQGSLDIHAARSWPVGAGAGGLVPIWLGQSLSGFGIGAIGFFGGVQWWQFQVRVTAAKFGVGHQRPLPRQFGRGVPAPPGLVNLRQ